MDNRIVKVNGKGVERLVTVLGLFEWKRVTGFNTENNQFVLFWTDHRQAVKLPTDLPIEVIAPMIIAWLENSAIYPNEPDHDGHNSKGWFAECHAWGHIDGFGYPAFAVIKPEWMMYGK